MLRGVAQMSCGSYKGRMGYMRINGNKREPKAELADLEREREREREIIVLEALSAYSALLNT